MSLIIVIFIILIILEIVLRPMLPKIAQSCKQNEFKMQIKNFKNKNKIKNILKNNKCELRLLSQKSNIFIYCKERAKGNTPGEYFEVRGPKNEIKNLWILFNIKFSDNVDCSEMNIVYDEFNISKTLFINYKYNFPYPDNLYNNEAQNEFCRMKITKTLNAYKLECYEIWGEAYTVYDGDVVEKYRKEKSFEIISDYENLYVILTKFYKQPNKFENFNFLEKKYSNYIKTDINNCTENDLKRLAGINLIMAKKIIKKRNEIGGFSSTQDFLEYINLKPHFVNQIKNKIFVKKTNNSLRLIYNKERQIDI